MADTQPYRSKPRGLETAGDMARSLVPIVIVIFLFVYFCAPKGGEVVQTVDVSDDISSTAEFADFAVLAPQDLPKQWRATSSKLLRDGTAVDASVTGLTIGYVSPKTTFARFTIRQGDPALALKEAVDGADITDNPTGAPIQVDARSWTPFSTAKGRGYVSVTGTGSMSVSLVVAGGAADAELRELIDSVVPIAKKP